MTRQAWGKVALMFCGLTRRLLVLAAAILAAAGANPIGSVMPVSLAHGESLILWSAGHEDGTLSEWQGSYGGEIYSIGAGRVNISSDYAHTGRNSAQLSITNAAGAEQGIQLHRWAESETHPEAYYSAWLYFPEQYSGMTWWNVIQWRSKVSSSQAVPFWILNVGNRKDGSMYFYLFDWITRKGFDQSVASIPIGRWVHVEAYYKQAPDKQGQVILWQDGTEILNVAGVTTRRPGDEIQWAINNYTDKIAPSNATIYVDDAAISLSRLGPGTVIDHGSQAGATTPPVAEIREARDYFVDSTAGSDSNPGTSSAAPWKTLAKVSASPLAPGDRVMFKRGGSWNGTLTITSSGTETSPIIIQAYGTGPSPEIRNVRANNSRTVVLYGNHIVFKDFSLHDAHEAGLDIRGSHNTVRDTEIFATGWGVRLLGQSNKVINNYIHDLLMIVDDPAPDNDFGAAGVVIWGGANASEIAYNRFERCRAPSQDYGYDGGVVEFWESSRDHNIHHNYSRENNGVFEIGGGTVSNVVIRNNMFFKDYEAFAGIHWAGPFAAAVESFKVENNSIVQQGDKNTVFGHWDGAAPDSNRVLVRNNIIASDHAVYSDNLFTHTGNTYFLMAGGTLGPNVELGADESILDPRFVDLSTGSLQLRSGTPAIAAGPDSTYMTAFAEEPVELDESRPSESGRKS